MSNKNLKSGFVVDNYRVKRFDDKYFLTLDSGNYCVLSVDEYERFKNNDLDFSLQKKLFDLGLLIDCDNISAVVSDTKSRNSFLHNGASLHIMILTNRCNMQCVYCHADCEGVENSAQDMTADVARQTVDYIFQSPSNAIAIEFQGGEPLLNFDVLKAVVDYAMLLNKEMKKDLRFQLVTNMISMTDEIEDYLVANNIGVCTSFDGPKELHDSNRVYFGGSSYDIVVKRVRSLNEKMRATGRVGYCVNALTTVTRKSLDYAKEIVDEYMKLGFSRIHLRQLNKLGVAKRRWSEIGYDAEEFLKFWSDSLDYILELKKSGVDFSERTYDIMLEKIKGKIDPNYLEMRSPCGMGIGQQAYDVDGKIYTCDEGRMSESDMFCIGNVFESNYVDVVGSDKLLSLLDTSIVDQYSIIDRSPYKPYMGVCPVCNYEECGSFCGHMHEGLRYKIMNGQFDWIVKNVILSEDESDLGDSK